MNKWKRLIALLLSAMLVTAPTMMPVYAIDTAVTDVVVNDDINECGLNYDESAVNELSQDMSGDSESDKSENDNDDGPESSVAEDMREDESANDKQTSKAEKSAEEDMNEESPANDTQADKERTETNYLSEQEGEELEKSEAQDSVNSNDSTGADAKTNKSSTAQDVEAQTTDSVQEPGQNGYPETVGTPAMNEASDETVDDSYIITFDLNGGYCSEELYDDVLGEWVEGATELRKQVTPGKSVNVNERTYMPVCNDSSKVFFGWSLSWDGDPIDEKYRYTPTESCTLYAVWRDTITITFDANGGYFAEDDGDNPAQFSIKIPKGASVENVDNNIPYVETDRTDIRHFGQWSEEKGGEAIPSLWSYYPTESCTLYAVWEEVVTVTFDANGGYITSIADGAGGWYVDNLPKYENIRRKGDKEYINVNVDNIDNDKYFAGWSDGNTVYSSSNDLYHYFIPEESCTLYAVWNDYDIYTFDANGGYFQDGERVYVEKVRQGNTAWGSTPEIEAENKIFYGWSRDKNATEPELYKHGDDNWPTEPCTLYAVWGDACNVTLDANGGYFSGNKIGQETVQYSIKLKKGSLLKINKYPKMDNDAKAFAGWSYEDDGSIIEGDIYPDADITIYAIWRDVYTITYDPNGGYFDNEYLETDTAPEGTTFTLWKANDSLYAPSDDVIFSGWSLEKDGETIESVDVTGDITVYAVWVTPYKITFDPNGGYFWVNGASYEPRTLSLLPGNKIGSIDIDRLVYVLYPENDDNSKQFLGWKLENTGDLITDIKEYIPNGDCTLYVVWSEDEVKVSAIQMGSEEMSIDKGFTKQISVQILPDDAADNSLTWTSSDETIAKVDKNGKVTGVNAGIATITALANDGSGVSATCTVTVTEKTISMQEVSAVSYNKLNVIWEKCEGAEGYMVYRKGNGEAYTLVKSLSGEDSTSFTNSVVSGAKYTYKVSAYKMDGTKKVILAQTGEMSGTALPAAPVMKSAGMAAFNKIKVIWTKVSGCAGYVIYRSTEEDGQYTVLKTVTMATATEYSNIVQDGQTYYYKIRAFVEVNGKKVYGDYSEVLSGDVIDAPPANFRLEQKTATKIVFNWDKVEDAEGYVIYRYFPETNKCKAIKNITSKDTLTYSYKADDNTDYQFTMRAFREVNGKKVYSDYTEQINN